MQTAGLPTLRFYSWTFLPLLNTFNPATLCNRLLHLQVHPSHILWIKDFLQVSARGGKWLSIQEHDFKHWCDLTPILFSIYTNNINKNSDIFLLKYADDMALVADIKDHSSLAAYYQQVNTLMLWIKESSLELNISKTKELCCGGRRTS